jgi:hypothetical protein
MSWKTIFIEPVVLNEGGVMATLDDARKLLIGLPALHQATAHWIYAGEMLLQAAENTSDETIREARRQLVLALKAEGLLT